jgi:hypothetical protein
LGPGDLLSLEREGRKDVYRIDRVEDLGHRSISAVRIEAGSYVRRPSSGPRVRSRVIAAATPVHVEMLDLPLLSGEEVPHAPHIAVAKRPWTGAVAIYSSSDDYGYAFNREIVRPAVIGTTLDPLPRGAPGLWMPRSFRVRINGGVLQSRTEGDVLNGANAAALRGSNHMAWEVLQFQEAELIAPGEYRIGMLLRGQAGTDGVLPDVWEEGADFILLNTSVVQIGLPSSARGLERHYRVGPAKRPYDDLSYIHFAAAFEGVGLRPYRPVHLRAVRRQNGDVALGWIRRTRIDGDQWNAGDAPLGEERETYHLRISRGGSTLRELSPDAPSYVYTSAEQVADDAAGPLVFEVAQVSQRFGPGPYERITFHG